MNRTFAALAFLALTTPALAADDDPALPIRPESTAPRTVTVLSYAAPVEADNPALWLRSRGSVSKTSSALRHAAYVRVHKNVNLKRLDSKLTQVLKRAAKHFGKQVRVTSGYRSPSYNRKVHGARHSLHMKGEAADISIPGVSKTRLAKWAKAQPEIGGIGLYCRSRFVHIDTGRDRHWYWPCRKKRHG